MQAFENTMVVPAADVCSVLPKLAKTQRYWHRLSKFSPNKDEKQAICAVPKLVLDMEVNTMTIACVTVIVLLNIFTHQEDLTAIASLVDAPLFQQRRRIK